MIISPQTKRFLVLQAKCGVTLKTVFLDEGEGVCVRVGGCVRLLVAKCGGSKHYIFPIQILKEGEHKPSANDQ